MSTDTDVTAWLIEVPQSGGATWWTGQEDGDGNLSDSSRLAWLKYFSADASKAVRFRFEADAQAVLRLLPQSWKLWTYPAVVTEHRWCSGPALAATPEPR